MNTINKQLIDTHIYTRIKLWFPPEIHEQIEYIYSDGKRIRPILCINSFFSQYNNISNLSNLSNLSIKSTNINQLNRYQQVINLLYDYSILIELIHCISLVLDDGPQMDNDIIRRNRPSFHTKWNAIYGDNYHIIFCYYLLSKVSIIISNITYEFQMNILQFINDRKFALIKQIFLLLSDNFDKFIKNLVDGQRIDLNLINNSNCNYNNSNNCNTNIILEKGVNIYPFIIELYLFYEYIIGIIFKYGSKYGYKTRKYVNKGQICASIINYLANSIELNIKKTSSLFNISFTTGYIYSIICKILFDDNIIIENTNNNNDNNNDNNDNNDNIIIDIKNAMILIEFIGNIYGILYQYNDDINDRKQDFINKKPNIFNDLLMNF